MIEIKQKEQVNFAIRVLLFTMIFSCLNGTLACIIAVNFLGLNWFWGLLLLPIVIHSFFPLSFCFSLVAVTIFSFIKKCSNTFN